MTERDTMFSVIVPVYNSERYIARTIQSILDQEDFSPEIIAINDGSTDRSAEILAKFGDAIKVIHQSNAGLAAARNSGLKIATGDYVMFLDADDALLPTACTSHYCNIQKHDEVQMSVGGWQFINEDESGVSRAYWPEQGVQAFGTMLTRMVMGNFLPVCAAAVRRDVLLTLGGFNRDLIAMEDTDFWVRSLNSGHTFHFFSEPVFLYRRHSESMTANYNRQEKAGDVVVEGWFTEGPLVDYYHPWRARAHAARMFRLARFYREKGGEEEARRCEARAVEYLSTEPGSLCGYYITQMRKMWRRGERRRSILYAKKIIRLLPSYLKEKMWGMRAIYPESMHESDDENSRTAGIKCASDGLR